MGNQFEDRVLDLERRVKTLNIELDKAQSAKSELAERVNYQRRDNSDLENEKAILSKSIAALQRQLDQRTTENDHLELKMHDLAHRLHSNSADASASSQQVDELKRFHERKLVDLKQQLKDAREEADRANRNLHQKNNEFEDSKICLADAEDAIHELKIKLKAAKDENTEKSAK